MQLLVSPGYHPESGGLWVVKPVPDIRLDMPLAESKEWLTDKLFADYDFATNGDLSRAVAQVVSPALKIGGLLGNVDYPMDFGLANKSQSGKSHRMRFTAWIYGAAVLVCARRAFPLRLERLPVRRRRQWKAQTSSPSTSTVRVGHLEALPSMSSRAGEIRL